MLENNIKEYRKKLDITQEELGNKLGYSKQQISKIENNKVKVSVLIALAMVEAFKEITLEKGQQIIVSVDDLFYIDKM